MDVSPRQDRRSGPVDPLSRKLPAQPAQALPIGSPTEVLFPSPGRRILVVDAYRDAADSLALILRLVGLEVAVAHDGPTALALARETEPDVVLLDIPLLGLDGYAVARYLRAAAGVKPPLLVAFTGYGREIDRVRSKKAGFDHHLLKTDTDQLLALLEGIPEETRPTG